MHNGNGRPAAFATNGCPSLPRVLAAKPPTLFISTGCTSSDIVVAPILAELQRRRKLGTVAGLVGATLRDLGVESFFDSTLTSSVGVVASVQTFLRHARGYLDAYRKTKEFFQHVRPALAILVDNPGNNLRLLALARRYRIPVLYYVPPELWSIWPWQARAIVERATVIAPIFGSEGDVYRARGGRVCCVGHPLVDLLGNRPRLPPPRDHRLTIGLFPGSRGLEVRDLMPILRGAAEIIHREQPQSQFIVCTANAAVASLVDQCLRASTLPVSVEHRNSHGVLARCDLSLTCSGTATLEAAVLGVPMVVMYRVHHCLDRLIAFCKLYRGGYPFVSLPNYLLKRPLVPEVLNGDVSSERVAREALALLRDPARRRAQMAGLAECRALLGPPGAINRAANLVESMLDGHECPPCDSQSEGEPPHRHV